MSGETALLVTVVFRTHSGPNQLQLFLRASVQLSSSSSSIEQDGGCQGIANGESSSEVPFICTSPSFTHSSRPAIIQDCVRIRDRDFSSPYSSIDRDTAVIAGSWRLGFETTSSGQVHFGKVFKASCPHECSRYL